jgi:hypothetical protein
MNISNKKLLEKLINEEDTKVLGEVLNFYGYLKSKEQSEIQRTGDSLEEYELPADEEIPPEVLANKHQ